MSAKTKRPEPERVIAAATAFDRRDLIVLRASASAMIDAIGHVDGLWPNPEARDDAARLRPLVDILSNAIASFDYIRGDE